MYVTQINPICIKKRKKMLSILMYKGMKMGHLEKYFKTIIIIKGAYILRHT